LSPVACGSRVALIVTLRASQLPQAAAASQGHVRADVKGLATSVWSGATQLYGKMFVTFRPHLTVRHAGCMGAEEDFADPSSRDLLIGLSEESVAITRCELHRAPSCRLSILVAVCRILISCHSRYS
jgi:hypothetical protein